MTQFYITHMDEYGERHQMGGAFEASTTEEAIAMMLADFGAENDGMWEAHEVTSENDII